MNTHCCPHSRQDLSCNCTAGDEQPNTEHADLCTRQGQVCDQERCSWQEFAASCMGCGKRRVPLMYPIEMWFCLECEQRLRAIICYLQRFTKT